MAAPPLAPRDLTIPEPGSTTAREVLSRTLSRVFADLRGAPQHAPKGAREEAAILAKLLRGAAGNPRAVGAIFSALRRPTLGGLLRCLRNRELANRDRVYVEMVAALAFELALAGVLDEPVRLSRPPARLLSIAARLAVDLAPGAVVLENGALSLEHDGGVARLDLRAPASSGAIAVTRPYHVVAGDILLAEVDNNPISMSEAHPDKEGNAVDLGGHPAAEWTSALGTALARIERHLPDLYAEMQLFVAQMVPVGWHAEKHLSASYQEIIGTIYLTLHPSQMTLSEALIHEFSHNKLNALFELDDVLENAWSPLYTSPVRPDPRPLHGVLLAVHAFLPVARLYERMIEAGDPEAQNSFFRDRYAKIRQINREGAEIVLDKGRPTAVGRHLFDEIARWHEHYAKVDAT